MENTEYIRKRDAIDMCGGYIELAYAMAGIEPADVVPVVHGRWVNGCCDKCGEHAPFWSMATTYYESNFCPNCGADMKRKEV